MFEDPETWVAVGFVIFVGLMLYLKVPAMATKALDQRADRIRDELDEARRLREEAQALLAEYQRKQHEAEREAEDIIAQAREDAEAYGREAREKLTESLSRRQRLAEEKIERAQADAIREIRSRAADVAVAAASRLIGEDLSAATSKRLIEEGIDAVREDLN